MLRCLLRGILIALSLLFVLPLPASAQRAPQLPPPIEFEYFYDVPSNRRLQPIYDRLTDRDVLAQLDKYLRPLRLPRKLTVRTKQCGDGNILADYKSGRDLVLCYEYLERVETLIKDAKVQSVVLANATRDGALAHALCTSSPAMFSTNKDLIAATSSVRHTSPRPSQGSSISGGRHLVVLTHCLHQGSLGS